MFQQKTKQTSFIVISVFSAFRDFVYFQTVMFFSEKCADPDEKSYYACGNSSRPSLFAKVPLRECFPKVVVNYAIYTQHVSPVSK